MKKIGVETFARHFKQVLQEQEKSYAFFLGAGCSMPDIPGAAALVKQWLPRLHKLETGGETPFEQWLKDNHDENNPAASYALVMQRLFWTPTDRQQEIERIVLGRDPGFAYAVLAQLLAHKRYGPRCNLVLTTNFDDMVADALYVYSQKKPLVIVHESLVEFADTGRSRPTVIKLHGDALLSPKNLEGETAELTPPVRKVLAEQTAKRGLIFIGYGGNDKSITGFFRDLSNAAFNSGVYWVNDQIPDNEFGAWLRANPNAFWVNHLRFDELMVLIRKELALEHPDDSRFSQLMDRYRETFSDLDREVHTKPSGPAKAALSSALEQARKEFKNWWAVEQEARRYKETEPDKADKIYQQGLDQFPESPELLDWYAIFLWKVCQQMDQAEVFYKRAIEADPNNAIALGNYANFLWEVRQQMDQAEVFYERAIEADPNNANNLGNYASFLRNVRQQMDQAEAFYKRAIEADPNNANNLGNYASFLRNVRQQMDQAEAFYKRAIEADPNNAIALGNYANFLWEVRQQMDQAEVFYERAIEADPNNANNLGNYASFLRNVRQQMDQAEAFFKRAIEADPNHANNLSNYATFLWQVRQQMDQAEAFYKRAVEADPNSASGLGGYASFLKEVRRKMDQAEAFYKRAIEADPNHASILGNYANILWQVRRQMDQAEAFYKRAIEAEPNQATNLSNYAGFLLAQGRTEEGLQLQQQALPQIERQTDLLEGQFYRYANAPAEHHAEALQEMKRLIGEGARSPGWNFSTNIARAEEDRHPNVPLLRALAAVIADGTDPATLDAFEEWQNLS